MTGPPEFISTLAKYGRLGGKAIVSLICLGIFGLGIFLLFVFLHSSFWLADTFAMGILCFLTGTGGAGIVSRIPFSRSTGRRVFTLGVVVLLFAGLCLVGILTLTQLPSSSFHAEKKTSPSGGLVGPIHVDRAGMRVEIRVSQSIDEPNHKRIFQRWSFVTVEILDQSETYLSGFGGELWHYAGYGPESGDGSRYGTYWNREKSIYKVALRIPSAGTYYLRLKTDANVSTDALSPIQLTMEERVWWGNPIPLRNAMLIALFVAPSLLLSQMARDYERL
jgi:hypothetical protein